MTQFAGEASNGRIRARAILGSLLAAAGLLSGSLITGCATVEEDFSEAVDTTMAPLLGDATDAIADPRTREFAEDYLLPLGITSMLDAPIYRDGRVCGVVCHEHVGPRRRWSTEDRDFAASVADNVALQFASAARAEAEAMARTLRHEMSELRRLRELSRAAAGAAHDFRNLLLQRRGSRATLRSDYEAELKRRLGKDADTPHRIKYRSLKR